MKQVEYPAHWGTEMIAKFERYQEYTLSDDEVHVLDVEVSKFKQSLEIAFGNWTEIALTAFVGSWLTHSIDEAEGLHVFTVVNDWFRAAIRQNDIRPFKLATGEPD